MCTLKAYMLDITIRSVSGRGVKKGGTWLTLRVPDQRHGRPGLSLCHEWCSFILRNIPWKFRVDISFGSVSGRGVKKGGTWRTLRVPDWRHGGQGHSGHHEWCSFTLWKIPWKFPVDISIITVSEMGGQEGGYLEDVEGFWRKTWRSGLSMRLRMYLVDPKDHILKVLCRYPYYWLRYSVNKENIPLVIMPTHLKLTQVP